MRWPATCSSGTRRLFHDGGGTRGRRGRAPMIAVRRAEERRHDRSRKREEWHTFSPDDRADPLADGFGPLEALDEARLPPGAGGRRHPNRDADIVTYVREGALVH